MEEFFEKKHNRSVPLHTTIFTDQDQSILFFIKILNNKAYKVYLSETARLCRRLDPAIIVFSPLHVLAEGYLESASIESTDGIITFFVIRDTQTLLIKYAYAVDGEEYCTSFGKTNLFENIDILRQIMEEFNYLLEESVVTEQDYSSPFFRIPDITGICVTGIEGCHGIITGFLKFNSKEKLPVDFKDSIFFDSN